MMSRYPTSSAGYEAARRYSHGLVCDPDVIIATSDNRLDVIVQDRILRNSKTSR